VIKRQHRGIDVLLIIDGSIAVCIEDKVGTTEHSEQLPRYLAGLMDDGYSEDRIIPVYVQTAEQSSYKGVEAAGFRVIRRCELVKLLREYLDRGGLDSIARDYHNYLADIDARVQAFQTRPFADWDSDAWQGFFLKLQNELGDGEWAYVPNQAGGFMGYWWNWNSDQDCDQYVQIQENSLCFKIQVGDAAKRRDLRARWNSYVLEAARQEDLTVVRPKRFREGKSMTVAVFDGDFRVANANGLLALAATVSALRRAAAVLNRAVEIANPGPSQ
jgi:hypothetical protein